MSSSIAPALAAKPTLPPNVHKYGVAPADCMFEVLDHVLSANECKALIKHMTPALKSVSGALTKMHPDGDQRRSKTEYHLSVMENKRFADIIWQRILNSDALPAIVNYIDREGCGMPLGLAPRLRMLRYLGDDVFDAHYDRIVPDEASGSESLITVLIYLNDGGGVDFTGGETVFLNFEAPEKAAGTAVTPKTGRIVLFEHCLYHTGSGLQHMPEHDTVDVGDGPLKNCKYIIRTDILFPINAMNRDKY
ncbi:hypothetical protein SPRG_04256 [Saprolegnia parasitica CBS 223.65]|uniref:Fe2OG dioxygenase domain-containing protein n=1 Tax=Saprolegnia parasitica (strain CBS 223.65) TaxID=695850 RepID=A0A067CWF3_SAPPC|nr:hypothetical protein SPRG_04256 [Saprolegnia parasitica CBS 223.65]KDO31117.1 hypothetical protein SPRG_04256 [Saprolegnia parasitica CBS 223.65]|eukprot:XP_012198246.1 hypothetical protein SPRG_04256 [Saprolegnia parasitica CBS 223.65]